MDTKTKTYKVASDLMPEFAGLIGEHELGCEVMGVTRKNKIILDVTYKPEEKEFIHKLSDLLDDYKEQQPDEEAD